MVDWISCGDRGRDCCGGAVLAGGEGAGVSGRKLSEWAHLCRRLHGESGTRGARPSRGNICKERRGGVDGNLIEIDLFDEVDVDLVGSQSRPGRKCRYEDDPAGPSTRTALHRR